MAKNAPVKKPKRRLKRSVRRSLSAVLMITAIGVAAIPVPENYAVNDDIALYADDDPVLPYSYGDGEELREFVTNANLAHIPVGDDEDPEDKGLTLAYTINALSDGSYQMDWQFTFFMKRINNAWRGIINEYNSLYAQKTVTLNSNVTCDYDIISADVFDDYFKEEKNVTLQFEYTVDDPTLVSGSDVETFLNRWFQEAYTAYVNGYAAAKARYDELYAQWQDTYQNDPTSEEAVAAKPVAPSFTRTLADLTDENKYVFFCENYMNGKYKGCKLARVIDSSQSTEDNPVNVRVYIPQRMEGQTPNNLMWDDQGFIYNTDASIIGIADEAFKGTHNVEVLTVADEIRYIGSSAFENSFIQTIDLVNVEQICDKAFKNCNKLTSVTFRSATTDIGTESFYGTGITSVAFPSSISSIGPGAFAECRLLQTIDFSGITASNVSINEYAFYNALALNTVNFMRSGSTDVTVGINGMGKCAFAVDGILTGTMTDFTFPTDISAPAANDGVGDGKDNVTGLGDYVLAGRSRLLRVIMPGSFGATLTAKVPDGTFYNCYNLEYVRFPDTCGRATYTSATPATGKGMGLFETVSNPDFYVWGPELDSARNQALPRQATWDAVTAVSDVVPYRYDKNGQTFYEVSDGTYLLCIDNNGILTSCTRKDTSKVPSELIDLVIPAKVGETEVTGIGSNCFSDDVLNQNVKSVKIEDDSKIATISAGVFQGWGELKEVYIGNSVTSIGANAFKDCGSLVDVTFSSPLGGHEEFTIGTDAFTTGSPKLTFHGDIVEGYAPFEWAMDPDNVINANMGLRVCYKSLSPTYLTVMYNPVTDMVTLLDYPKYDEISSILNEAHQDDWKGRYDSYEDMRVKQLYAQFAVSDYDGRRTDFAIKWQEYLDNGEDPTQLYSDSVYYGPWVNPDFCKGDGEYGWKKYLSSDTVSGNSSENSFGEKVTDFFFEPIIAYAAENDPTPYYETYKFDVAQIVGANDPYRTPSEEERALVLNTRDIVIPAGVESIDVYGYRHNLTEDGTPTNNGENSNNYSTYLLNSWDAQSANMYLTSSDPDEDGIRAVPGLFSGYYEDGSAAPSEKRKRGNDLITSVTMSTVKYLPDYAFDSCEGLNWVILGSEMEDIGKAPFRGCYSLTNVNCSGNEKYSFDNGIIYSNNTDSSLMIEECLAARGNLVGQIQLSADTDPSLLSVSTIREGAFEDCDYINEVNFGQNNTAGLTVIPEDCFKNCDSLQRVTLPKTVNDVKQGAFVNITGLTDLYVYGKEVQISAKAFDGERDSDGNLDKRWTTVYAYEDSAVVRYVGQYGTEYKLQLSNDWLGEVWQVSFYDQNYELIEDMKDLDGEPLRNPQDVPNGERPTTPQNPPNTDDWTFERWVGMNNVKLGDRIYDNTAFYAQGYSTSGLVNGKYPVSFWDGVDGTQVGPMQYIDPGSSAIPPAHPSHEGYEPDGYSEDYTNVQSPMTIIMLYKPTGSGSGTGTGTGTGSGGSTQNSSNKSSNNSSSNTSSGASTTSASSNSTSTLSGMYTVTVINGSGSGNYAPGATVLIQANTPAAGSVFSKWTTESQGVSLASVSTTPTTFTMPSNNVTITAEFTAGTATTGGSGSTAVRDTGNGSTRVDITKPGISNKDLATATVNGSTDNFVVKITETDEATRAVQEALTNKYGSLENILYYAMDISLYDSTGTVKITNTAGLSVDITIPIPDALVAYGGNNMAGAVVNSNQLENLSESFTTINGVPCIRFTATHFSPYTIYVDTGNLTEGMLDVTPKTGDPIHPKWFLSIGLACLSIILFMKKDKAVKVKTA